MSDYAAQAAGEGMSEERLARLAGLAELPCTCGTYDCERYTSALTKDETHELLAEVRRARRAEAELCARLAEIGETEVEWAVRWPTAGGRYAYELCDSEEEAREADPGDGSCEVVRRVVGGWREVPDA